MKLHQFSLGLLAIWTTFHVRSSERPKKDIIPAPHFLNAQGQFYTPPLIQQQALTNNYSLQYDPFFPQYLPSYSIPRNTYTIRQNLNTSEETNILYIEDTIAAYQGILTLRYLLQQTKNPENRNLNKCCVILKQNINKHKNSNNLKTKEQLTALEIFENRGLENLFKTLRSTPDLSIITNNQTQHTDTTPKNNVFNNMPELPPANTGQKSTMPKTILKKKVKENIEQLKKK